MTKLVAFVELMRWLDEGGMLGMVGYLALFDFFNAYLQMAFTGV